MIPGVITTRSIDNGRRAFHDYQRYLACGMAARDFDAGRFRLTGPSMIVGAIYACIERGWTRREELIAAVGRATRCKSWTVAQVLDDLTGSFAAGYPLESDGKRYRLQQPARRQTQVFDMP